MPTAVVNQLGHIDGLPLKDILENCTKDVSKQRLEMENQLRSGFEFMCSF